MMFQYHFSKWGCNGSNCLFVQVLRLLEDIGLPELVINLATLAISEAANDERSQVTTLFVLRTINSLQ